MRTFFLLMLALVAESTFSNESITVDLVRPCGVNGQIHYRPVSSKDEAQTAQLKALIAAKYSFNNFCLWNRMDRQTGGLPPEQLQKYRSQKVEGDMPGAIQILLEQGEYDRAWDRSMSGPRALKDRRGDSYFHLNKQFRHEPEDILNFLEQVHLSDSKTYEVDQLSTRVQITKALTMALIPGCREFLSLSKCLKMVSEDTFIKDSDPLSKTVGVKKFATLLNNGSLTEGYRQAALTTLKMETAGNGSSLDIVKVLKESFSSAGLNEADSLVAVWNTMYLYSVGGPNFSQRAIDKSIIKQGSSEEVNPNVAYVQAFIEGLVKIDGQNSEKGRSIFSLPIKSNFSCDIGKSYHYWMSAAIAREFREKGYSIEDSAKFAMTIATQYHIPLGYGLISDLSLRSGPKDYARFGTLENGIRLDLNLAAAGAVFGATNGNTTVDVQDGYIQSLKFSSLSTNIMGQSSISKNEWHNRYAVNRMIEYYIQQID